MQLKDFRFGIIPSITLAASVCFSPLSHAEEPQGAPPKQPAPSKPDEKTTRDPTQPSTKLKEALKAAEKPSEAPAAKPQHKLPSIALKALVQNAEGKTRAIIQVNKELFPIEEGTELSVVAPEGGTIGLVVRKLSADGAIIEVPSLKQTLNLH